MESFMSQNENNDTNNTNEEYYEEEKPRSYFTLIALLLIFGVVTSVVVWVNVAKPPKFLAWRDAQLAKLNIHNPFEAEIPADIITDPDKIPEAVRTADEALCKQLEGLGVIVIRDSLTKMASVVHISAETNSDEVAELVGKLMYLNAINITNANLTDAQIAHWVTLKRVTSLNAANNPITGASVASIAQMCELDGVYLEGTQISGDGLDAILSLPHVKILNINGTKLTDADMKVIGQMKSLHWVLAQDLNLTDECLPYFMDMPNLKTLTIKEGNQITPEGAQKFIQDYQTKNGTKIEIN